MMHPALMFIAYRQLKARQGLQAMVAEQRAADEAVPAGETSPATPEPVKRGPGRPRKAA